MSPINFCSANTRKIENTWKYFFFLTKILFSKIYINTWEDFKDIFEYERKNMKLSHVSFFIHLSLMWKGLVPAWSGTIKTYSLYCCPSTSFIFSRANTKGCSQPILPIISLSHETDVFLYSKSMKAHANYKGYTSTNKRNFLSYISQDF